MGERVYVELIVLSAQKDQTIQISQDTYCDPDSINEYDSGDYSCLSYEEVKNGNFPDTFTDALEHAGIAYEYSHESFGEYCAWECSLRFTPEGALVHKQVYANDRSIDLSTVKAYLDANNIPELLIHIDTRIESNEVLPWDNQIEYGKLYQMKQLIGVK